MENCILCKSNAIINSQENTSRVIYNCPNCGIFVVSDLAEKETMDSKAEIKAFLMSRKASAKSDILLISFDKARLDKDYLQLTVKQICDLFPKSFAERMDMALINLSKLSRFEGDEIKVDGAKMAPYFYVRNEADEALIFVIRSMQKAGLIDVNYYGGASYPFGVTISVEGWDRLCALDSGKDSRRKTIFACAPREEGDLNDQFAKALQKAAKECDLRVSHDLSARASHKIGNSLIADIKSGNVIVCDFSEQTYDAYYTAALAQGFNKFCILTCHESMKKKLQINTDQFSFIFWDKQETLYLELLSTIKAKM